MSEHTWFSLSHERKTVAPMELVMERIARPSTWPDWVPEITATTSGARARAGDDVAGRAEMLGFGVDGRAHIAEATPARFVQDVVVGVRMVATYEIEPTSDGAVVRHHLTVSSPGGVLGSVLAGLLRVRLRAMQRRLLRNLIGQVEASASVEGGQESDISGRISP